MPETLELALAEARELVPGAEVVAVSAKTGAGLDELRAALGRAPPSSATRCGGADAALRRPRRSRCTASAPSSRARSGRARSARATCSASSRRGSTYACAASRCTTSRSSGAEAGQRVAVALPGIERSELAPRRRARRARRLPRQLPARRRARGARPIPARGARPPRHDGDARARRAGRRRFAQLRLDAPVVAARGDRVVLRAGTTVGGGRVLDRRRRATQMRNGSSAAHVAKF